MNIQRLFNNLRAAARVGWNYSLIVTDTEITVCFHGQYYGDGFEDFCKEELEDNPLFKWSDLQSLVFVFSHSY